MFMVSLLAGYLGFFAIFAWACDDAVYMIEIGCRENSAMEKSKSVEEKVTSHWESVLNGMEDIQNLILYPN